MLFPSKALALLAVAFSAMAVASPVAPVEVETPAAELLDKRDSQGCYYDIAGGPRVNNDNPAIGQACDQLGSFWLKPGEQALKWIEPVDTVRPPGSGNGGVFVGFRSTRSSGDWYIDPNFCKLVMGWITKRCNINYQDSTRGGWWDGTNQGVATLDTYWR
jgi:hypothetical protein